MPQPIGYAFAPTAENAQERSRGGLDQSQRALQTLSFSLPSFAGAGRRKGLSPLQGQSYAGSPISQAVLQSVLRTVLGVDAAASFGGDGGSSDPAGVYGPSGGEVSPSFLQSLTGGRTPTPVIHPGGDERIKLDEGGSSTPGMGYDPPTFDRTGASGEPRGQSPFADWADQERGLGRQMGYQPPDFSGGFY